MRDMPFYIRWLSCLILLLTSAHPILAAELPQLQKDIEFAKVGDVSLKLDAFAPTGDGPFPTCILVHGGAFMRGTKQSYITPIFEPLSKAGFVWFTIDYRLAPDHRWPACADDVQTAIRWVKEHAKEYKVDTKRIALIGESAGGHLVSYVGALGKDDTSVAAVVPFYAPHDFVLQNADREKPGPSMVALFNLTELNDESRKIMTAASPSSKVHAKMPPYLLIHGDKDAQVPLEQSVRFQELMKKHGNECDLITIPGGAHGMGSWKMLDSDYQEQMIVWLKKKLR
jgi:acetyl esterase